MKFISRTNSLKALLINLSLVIGLITIISFVFFYWYLPYISNKDKVVIIPDLRGQNIEQAINSLKERNLKFEILSDSGYSSECNSQVVLAQYPKSPSKVKIGRTINLRLNARIAPLIIFPDLTGSTFDLAQKQLTMLGFKIGKVSYTPDVAVNTILSTQINGVEIRAKEKIHKGTKVDLVIGSQAEK